MVGCYQQFCADFVFHSGAEFTSNLGGLARLAALDHAPPLHLLVNNLALRSLIGRILVVEAVEIKFGGSANWYSAGIGQCPPHHAWHVFR